MELLIALLALIVGGALGAAIGWMLARRRTQSPPGALDPAVLAARHDAELAGLRAQFSETRSKGEAERAALTASLAEVREQLAQQQAAHRLYAERVEAERAERLAKEKADAAGEHRVLEALSPVQETITAMQKQVAELELQRAEQHGQLSTQLQATIAGEERLRATAEQLASALSNNAQRGVWGEAQLRTLVESAGLVNRVDFVLQTSIEAESGARRPDLVVHLPGGKSIPVDAKVPYDAYMEASAIPATAIGDEASRRTQLLTKHAKQVKSHVDALAGKQYWTGLDASPEFTIAFIPNEPLLAAALQQDPTLMEYAFGKRIALASPVSFWAVLKTVAFTWQQEVLTEDAKRVFNLSTELANRVTTLAEHADKLGSAIGTSVKRYNEFASSLESRVLVTARKLNQLDDSKLVTAPKALDEVPKQLTAPELVEALDGSE